MKFDYELSGNIKELKKKEDSFLKYMKRKKKCCIGYSGRCGICIQWYSVFDGNDFKMYQEHEARIHADVEKFWTEVHNKRMNENMNAAV